MIRKIIVIMILAFVTAFLCSSLKIPIGKAGVTISETIMIMPDGSVDPPTAPIHRDGNTYTLTSDINCSIWVFRNDSLVDGAGHTILGEGVVYSSGIRLGSFNVGFTANNVTVKNMNIRGFYYGIWLFYCANIDILGNNITNNYYGIYREMFAEGVTISGNNFRSNTKGITLDISRRNTISGNTMTNTTEESIDLRHAINNTISENSISNIGFFGIRFERCDNNTIHGNDLSNCGLGLSESHFNMISENTVSNCSELADRAIDLYNSYNNTFVNNTLANSYYGVFIYGTVPSLSVNNTFHHNNFIDNKNHVNVGGVNRWDDGFPSGGNYWSNYQDINPNATEVDDSGIWDTPYVSLGLSDNYPLVAPTRLVTRTFKILSFPVEISSKSSISGLALDTASKTLRLNVTGLSGTNGFCDILVPDDLMWGDFSLFKDGSPLVKNIDYTEDYNGTYYSFHITYAHTSHRIEIVATHAVPEFPSFLVIPLLVATTSIAVLISKRKRPKTL
jgi:parallel beta-helix repeat protein